MRLFTVHVPFPDDARSQRRRLIVALVLVPLALMLGKLPGMPTAARFSTMFTLEGLPLNMHRHLEYVLFTPMATIIVVLFRLTLGLEVFGLWRPILLAVAFHLAGLQVGLTFLVIVMTAVVLVRPVLSVRGLHSYARNSVALGTVVILMLATVAFAARWQVEALLRVSHFPIISLCLISENFASTLYDKGLGRAARRAAATIVCGVLISLLYKIPGGTHLLLRFPELLMAQIGGVLLIAEFLNFRLLGEKNPPAAPEETAAIQTIYQTSGAAGSVGTWEQGGNR